jgi:hypothetical protein
MRIGRTRSAAGGIHPAWDLEVSGDEARREAQPFVMLFVALLIALGFECVNGFHDTANAVATVSPRLGLNVAVDARRPSRPPWRMGR